MSKKEVSLSWDAFQSMGNPENAPKMPKEEADTSLDTTQRIRVFLDRKRGGKVATLLKGFHEDDDLDTLKELAKRLKVKCGVGGSFKNHEILIQGDHREKVIQLLKAEGFKDVKKSGG
jgi:translation initiation factor 1